MKNILITSLLITLTISQEQKRMILLNNNPDSSFNPHSSYGGPNSGFLEQDSDPSSCSNFEGQDTCKLPHQTTYPAASSSNRNFQTPPRGSEGWVDSFQDFSVLQGHISLEYQQQTDNNVKCATVKVNLVKKKEDIRVWIQYGLEEPVEDLLEKVVCSDQTAGQGPLEVGVHAFEAVADLYFDPIDFIWNAPQVNSKYGHDGKKGAIVELFGWPFEAIGKECEMIGNAGYLGVKIWPPTEHVTSDFYLQYGELNPWWFIYQPVSYRLHSRLGTRDQLRDMVHQCRRFGVRVYADAVINHMSGSGNDVGNHRMYVPPDTDTEGEGYCATWGAKHGTAGSPFFTHGFAYEPNPQTHNRPALEYPAVPYSMDDFHCERKMKDWQNPFDLNFGWLFGLTDLATEKLEVRERISTMLVDMMSLGISGFRIDAAKHMDPRDISAIIGIVKRKLGGEIPSDFLVWLEVIMSDESKEWLACDVTVKGYNYFDFITDTLRDDGLTEDEIDGVKITASDYPVGYPLCGEWVMPPSRLVIANEDHDQQKGTKGLRPLGNKGSVLVIDKNKTLHQNFEKKLFEQESFPADIRLILSSYSFISNGAMGFPDGQSDCYNYKGDPVDAQWCRSVPYQNAYNPWSCGYDVFDEHGNWREGSYSRVHRDREIILAMREWMGLSAQTSTPNGEIGIPDYCY